MAWIKSHSELMTHPKVRKAARVLEISVITMIGHLHALWWWAVDHAPDGLISAYDPEEIADAVMWEGDVQAFLRALVECGARDCPGLLDELPDGGLTIHDWEEHCSKEYEKRKKDAERMKRYRAGKKHEQANSDSGSSDAQNANVTRTLRERHANEAETFEECNRDVRGEREREKEIEKEIKSSTPDRPDCPHGKIVEMYHEILPELPQVQEWGETRQGFLKQRWRERPERQSLDWWRAYFLSVRNMDWLMGRRTGKDGRPFLATLEWLVRPTNFINVIEGKYLNRDGPPKNGITDAEKKAIIAKYTNGEGQRDDRSILRELRALEHERGLEPTY